VPARKEPAAELGENSVKDISENSNSNVTDDVLSIVEIGGEEKSPGVTSPRRRQLIKKCADGSVIHYVSWLACIPEELLYIVNSFLTESEMFDMCVASSRQIPQWWGVTLQCYSQRMQAVQHECESQGILTEIASQAQQTAQEKWVEATQQRQMLGEDTRRQNHNIIQWDLDMEEHLEKEHELLRKFQASVGVLGDVMGMWGKTCKRRDLCAKGCSHFHIAIGTVFAIK
jgi:hypothetical protein